MIRPDNFKADPYGYATNQLGHALAVGCLGLVYAVVLACWYVLGEFPPKWSIIAGAGIGYLAFEWITQGWRGWDTVEDWVFVVVYGTAAPVMIFSEVTPGSDEFRGSLTGVLPWAAMLYVHVGLGSLLRWWQARHQLGVQPKG